MSLSLSRFAQFATRIGNVFAVGKGGKSLVTMSRSQGMSPLVLLLFACLDWLSSQASSSPLRRSATSVLLPRPSKPTRLACLLHHTNQHTRDASLSPTAPYLVAVKAI